MAGGKILLVEGTDDVHVLKHICGNRSIPHLDEVFPAGGDERLLEHIPVRLMGIDEEGAAVGVIIDADTSVTNRWQSIRDLFLRAGYQDVPAQPDPKGTILDPPDDTLLPRAGVWIIPESRDLGGFPQSPRSSAAKRPI